ncbi:MAG: hypothetical protein KGZ57_09625 [Dethiobacter sp.]|nr:hypothetical protein [Dethiobacter sp.]MCL5982083.1 hypothetical protein [Bacillota bacterium]
MLIVKKESRVRNKSLIIELPEEFKDRDVEITIRLKRDIERDLLTDQIKIDTKKWKFDRDEIYAR